MKFYTKEESGSTALFETPGKISRNDYADRTDSSESFHFWLVVTLLGVFILILFYSQKIQGLM